MSRVSETYEMPSPERIRELAAQARADGKHALGEWLDECADKEEEKRTDD